MQEQRIKELLPSLKEELGSTVVDSVSDDQLLQFLRWKPTVARASERFRAFLTWKERNKNLFDDSLRMTEDEELIRLLESKVIVAPPQLTTKSGSPILIGRLRNNDMTDGRTVEGVSRMMFYTIDRVLELPESCQEGVTILHDLKGFRPTQNAHLGIPKVLFEAIFGQFSYSSQEYISIECTLCLSCPFQNDVKSFLSCQSKGQMSFY